MDSQTSKDCGYLSILIAAIGKTIVIEAAVGPSGANVVFRLLERVTLLCCIVI